MRAQSSSGTDPLVERGRVHELLKSYGWNATSFQTLAPDFLYWFCGEDACVAYVDTGKAWVAAGAPIGPPERIAEVALQFVEAAAEKGRRACFFGTEVRFMQTVPFRAIHIGEQPAWNPQLWGDLLRSNPGLREQLRRARAKGVVVREVSSNELALPDHFTRLGIEALMQRWLDARRLPPMRFLVTLEPFTFLDEKRCWVAEYNGRQCGLLVAVPVYGRQGWFFENLLRESLAPNGTTELLIEHGMSAVREQGCSYVTLGLVPLSGPLGSLLRVARFLGRGLYDFEGLRRFKAKLRPHTWAPIFLSVPGTHSGAFSVYDVLVAFAGRSLGHFGANVLRERPAFLAGTLAVSLIPWTLVLALSDPSSWFPTRAVGVAWTVFDLLLVVGLSWLAGRWRRWLGILLAACITIDAALTLVEGLAFNVHRNPNPLVLGVVFVAVLGPSAAAFLLWRAILATRQATQRLSEAGRTASSAISDRPAAAGSKPSTR